MPRLPTERIVGVTKMATTFGGHIELRGPCGLNEDGKAARDGRDTAPRVELWSIRDR
jgi:hypothetical protein